MSENEQCCKDELFIRLTEYGVDGEPDFDFNEEIEWFLDWARRRESQVAGWLVDALQAIATEDFNNVGEIRNFAAMMLKRYATLKPKRIEMTGEAAIIDNKKTITLECNVCQMVHAFIEDQHNVVCHACGHFVVKI